MLFTFNCCYITFYCRFLPHNTCSAQPPLELLRQWADYGGWYDRKERTFRKVIDTVLLAAMGPPGGGRNPITGALINSQPLHLGDLMNSFVYLQPTEYIISHTNSQLNCQCVLFFYSAGRLVRHFNLINATPQDAESMAVIFNTILSNTLGAGGFADPVKALSGGAVGATIRLYTTLSDQLLPTPSKPHYTFNLRDGEWLTRLLRFHLKHPLSR